MMRQNIDHNIFQFQYLNKIVNFGRGFVVPQFIQAQRKVDVYQFSDLYIKQNQKRCLQIRANTINKAIKFLIYEICQMENLPLSQNQNPITIYPQTGHVQGPQPATTFPIIEEQTNIQMANDSKQPSGQVINQSHQQRILNSSIISEGKGLTINNQGDDLTNLSQSQTNKDIFQAQQQFSEIYHICPNLSQDKRQELKMPTIEGYASSILIQQKQATNAYQLDDHKLSQQTQKAIFLCSTCSNSLKNVPAVYVNLTDLKTRRFLCSECLVTADKFLIPLNLKGNHPPEVASFLRKITINKRRVDRVTLRDKIDRIFNRQIDKKLNSFIEMLQEYTSKFKKQLMMQYRAVTYTLNEHAVEEFLQRIKDGLSKNHIDQFQEISCALRYAGFRDYSYIDQLMETVEFCFQSVGTHLQKEHRQLKSRFQAIDKTFMKYRIGRVYQDKRQAIKNFIDKDKHKGRPMDRSKNNFPQKSTNESSILIIDSDDQVVNKGESSIASIASSNFIQKTPTNSIIMKSIQSSAILNKPVDKIQQLKPIQLPKPPVPMTTPEPQLYTVEVDVFNCETVWERQSKNQDKVQRIIINFENNEERALRNMAMYSRLQQIIIYDFKLAKKQLVLFYLQTFSDLKRLQLNCQNDFDYKCIQKLVKKGNMDVFSKVFYGSNYYRNLAKLDERRSFPEDSHKQRQSSLPNNQTQILFSLPNLQNIWIGNPTFEMAIKLKDKASLKHLSLGERFDQEARNVKLQKRTWQILSKLNGLVSISLRQIEIEGDYFEQMLIRNKQTLQTLCLYDCRKLRDHTMAVIRQNLDCLKELSLHRCGEVDFKGDDIWEFTTIQTLIVRECTYMDWHKAQHKIKCLTNLKHLNIMGNISLTDQFVKNACQNKKLIHFNFANTNITGNCTPWLKTLTSLRALNVGATKVKGSYVVEITKQMKLLRKLSVRGLGVNDNISNRGTMNTKQMIQIGNNVPYITHLDISGCQQVENSIFQNFQHLRFVNVWMTNQITKAQKAALVKKGVQVIEDIYESNIKS